MKAREWILMKELKLRPVTMEDAELILEWRNDADTRANSFQGDIILKDTHMAWLKNKLESKNAKLFMVLDHQEEIGHIRLDILGNIGEISYMVAPEKRGQGYGEALLTLLCRQQFTGIEVLVGMVQKKNSASGKCFTKAGFTCLAGGDTDCYIKVLFAKQ